MKALLQPDGSLLLWNALETLTVFVNHRAYPELIALFNRHASVSLSAAQAEHDACGGEGWDPFE